MKSSSQEAFLRYRSSLGVLVATLVLGIVLVQTLPFAHMAWGTVTGGPGLGLVQDMRQALLAQKRFRKMLVTHEQSALARHRETGTTTYQARRLVRVNLTPLGFPGFHDIFAVRVRTDIVGDSAYTSFLARPGVVFDADADAFFARQCEGPACRTSIQGLVGTGHSLLRWGVITPYRLNITEMDATSSVSIGREPVSTSEWASESQKLHYQGRGRSFADRTLSQ